MTVVELVRHSVADALPQCLALEMKVSFSSLLNGLPAFESNAFGQRAIVHLFGESSISWFPEHVAGLSARLDSCLLGLASQSLHGLRTAGFWPLALFFIAETCDPQGLSRSPARQQQGCQRRTKTLCSKRRLLRGRSVLLWPAGQIWHQAYEKGLPVSTCR